MESYRASNLLCVPVSHYDQTKIKKDRVAKNIAQRKEYELLLLMKSQQNLISTPSNLTTDLTLPTNLTTDLTLSTNLTTDLTLPTNLTYNLTTDFSLLPKLTSPYELLAPTKLPKIPVNTQVNNQPKKTELKNIDQACDLYIIIFMFFVILLLMLYIKSRNLNKLYYIINYK
jgi:hypothetical protein